jgi:hypothetical protein
MTTRTRRKFVVFKNAFELKDVGRVLPPGSYEVVTDEELVEGLSFPVYRRVATMIMVPAPAPRASATEMLNIDPVQLAAAEARDASAGFPGSRNAPKGTP